MLAVVQAEPRCGGASHQYRAFADARHGGVDVAGHRGESKAARATANAGRADGEAQAPILRSPQRRPVVRGGDGSGPAGLREGQIDQMRVHLEVVEPQPPETPDRRGFEWYYLRRLCDASTRTLRGHTGAVYGVAFSPDGRRLVSAGSFDGTWKIWDVGSGQLIRSQQLEGVACVAYSPDGRMIATSDGENAARLWDAASGAALADPARTLGMGHIAGI